ncbi:tocopherol cyclase family protein [Conexibacter sp. SYSU D00693]|uniref:tocopherol cyclase family protein n=1 Tax=Conexibacter sp. SYSU D00693 TaxID=2812560 RepID=UPI00196A870F|nr:tocopherol cyclase family protein [Conexibacter sp. SYSU D00693]
MLARYRATGADPPFGDPRRPHGTAMEGWFWRITHAQSGTVAIVLLGVNRDRTGAHWGTVGLAVHPGGFHRAIATSDAHASPSGDVVRAVDDGRTVCRATPTSVAVDLGEDARLEVRLDGRVPWPRRAFGALGAAQALPGLSQYWHPTLLGARVTGTLQAAGRTLDLEGATAYAEKNWGSNGFPEDWWWGQAHGFDREDVCVAFAGGRAGVGRLRTTATALVVRVGDRLCTTVRPLQPLRVAVSDRGWHLRTRDVEVEGHANGTAPHLLPVPLPRERRHLDEAAAQHLAGHLRVAVKGRRGRTAYEGVSVLAGLERGRTPRATPPPGAPPAPAARPR